MSIKTSKTKIITLNVESQRSCPIIIGNSILSELNKYISPEKKQKIAIISNKTVAKHYLNQIKNPLEKNNTTLYLEIEDNEKSKNFVCYRLYIFTSI